MTSVSETRDGVTVTVEYPTEADIASASAMLPIGGGVINLPAGTIAMTDTLSFINRAGCHLVGAGAPGVDGAKNTRLVWAGPTDGRPMIDFSGTRMCSIKHLGLVGKDRAYPASASPNVVGIYARGNPVRQGCFFNVIEDVYLQDHAIGIDLGTGADQVDSFTLRKLWGYLGPTSTGVRINSTNSLTIAIEDSTFGGVGGSTPDGAMGVHVVAGALKARNVITANTEFGIRLDAMVGTSSLVGCHSEKDRHPIFTPITGNHQHANSLVIEDFYAYACSSSFMHLGNANMQYRVTGAYCQPSGLSAGDIFVPDNPVEVWLDNVTFPGKVRRASDSAETTVFGYYGGQGPGTRYLRVPTLEMRSPNGTLYRLSPPNAGGAATWTAV